jgi:ribokinase
MPRIESAAKRGQRMITVFGSINLDLIGKVERLPGPGETVPGGAFLTAPGGKGANQALAARRAGAPVRIVGAVGRDAFADAALALIRSAGVELSRVRIVEVPTGVALILVDRAGENVIAVIAGANFAVTEADAEALDFGAGDVLVLQLEVPVAASLVAARRARAAGALVLLNVAPFRAEAVALAAHATHLIVNETECALLAGAFALPAGEPRAQAGALAAHLDTIVVLTLGGDGAVAVGAEASIAVPALAIDPVDTVAAGDTFCGTLAAMLAEGRALPEALRYASVAAGLACTRAGAQPSIPVREAVEAALPRLA